MSNEATLVKRLTKLGWNCAALSTKDDMDDNESSKGSFATGTDWEEKKEGRGGNE